MLLVAAPAQHRFVQRCGIGTIKRSEHKAKARDDEWIWGAHRVGFFSHGWGFARAATDVARDMRRTLDESSMYAIASQDIAQ